MTISYLIPYQQVMAIIRSESILPMNELTSDFEVVVVVIAVAVVFQPILADGCSGYVYNVTVKCKYRCFTVRLVHVAG